MIKFGTDGWRAIISDEFTFDNVRKVSKAIALYLIESKVANKPVIIGYDARFLADKFAIEVAKVMESAGINCLLTERDTPTPIIAWEVRDKQAAGAVVLTASHNPAEYCGMKFIPHYAGPADETITKILQEYSNKDIEIPKPAKLGTSERFEPRERYFKYLEKYVDKDLVRSSKIKVVYDPMFGVGRGYMDKILQEYGCVLEVIHGYRDVLFGGQNPEPDDEFLEELKHKVVELKANVGLANDGDADRFGVVDEKGKFYSANQLLPMVFNYLVVEKGYKGSVVRSVATTHFVDRIAKAHNIKLHETPVGFKHIAQIMMKESVIVGGEESGGLSVLGHVPEKDGLLANLLIVEMLAKTKKPLSVLWSDLLAKYGPVFTQKQNLKLTEEKKVSLMQTLKTNPPKDLAGIKVDNVNMMDGVKLIFADGSWILVRPSGTEPLVRVYAESSDQNTLNKLIQAFKSLV